MNTENAIKITLQTLVGTVEKDFPREHGNCFTVETDTGKNYCIVNFYIENLEEAVKRGIFWPIKILALDDGTGIIMDERIPENWYRDDYCECCCPRALLPHNQIMSHLRAEARGEEVHWNGGTSYYSDKRPDIRTPEEKAKDEEKHQKMAETLSKIVIKEDVGIVVLNDYAVSKVQVNKECEED
jgi:hypothetical protein